MAFLEEKLLVNEKDNISVILPENYIPNGPEPEVTQEEFLGEQDDPAGDARSADDSLQQQMKITAVPEPKPPRLHLEKGVIRQSPNQRNRYLRLMAAMNTVQISPTQVNLKPPRLKQGDQGL